MTKYLWIILALAFVLRVWQLDKVPVSLFGDELDVGYHAYSLFQTGKDYTGNFLPLHLRSLAEFRTPLYIYAAVPTVAIFGITPLGVRLPAAIFGVLGIWALYLLVQLITGKKSVGLLAALLLALTPWHIHYSRAGFEVTQLLFLYVIGIYLFLRGLKDHRYLLWSAISLALTPWVYSTAKLFLPLTAVGLLAFWWREIWMIPRKKLTLPVIIFMLIAGGFAWNTVFNGGVGRFDYVSIFNKDTLEGEVGEGRLVDHQMGQSELSPLFHNRFAIAASDFTNNYLKSFSADFLFLNGDPSPRHSPHNTAEVYGFGLLFLAIGMTFFFNSQLNFKYRALMFIWLVTVPIPSALTQGGGTHATRLFLMLPPLILLMAYGIYMVNNFLTNKLYKNIYQATVIICLILGFVIYQHQYWVHYPLDSERWWQAGFQQAIQSAVQESKNYNQVIISNADEPTLIFFLGWSEFSPSKFQSNYPLKEVDGGKLGRLQQLDNYYFTSIGSSVGFYDLANALPDNSLYLATQKEVNVDLINDPSRLPANLKLIKAISYPSGKPAFYLLTKNPVKM